MTTTLPASCRVEIDGVKYRATLVYTNLDNVFLGKRTPYLVVVHANHQDHVMWFYADGSHADGKTRLIK